MTHEYINELLEEKGECPVVLDSCVLNIREDRSVIYSLWGDTDFNIRTLEVCYADNHSDVIFEGSIETKEELTKAVFKTLDIVC